MRIEDYAMIGDTQTSALVGRDGSIDWLCLPRFDSPACFAALLGDRGNGRWKLAPAGSGHTVKRRYLPDSLVLETEYTTPEGVVRVTDCMPIRTTSPDIVRLVEGISGTVQMDMDLVVRFDFGATVPWVRNNDGVMSLVAGPNALELASGVEVHGEDMTTRASFTVGKGDRVPFVLTWHPSVEPAPLRADPFTTIVNTVEWWHSWANQCTGGGRWETELRSSLIVLKALTYSPTGGIVAAPTTSLPEVIGGVRNWDYRYCWLRDATFSLQVLLSAGYESEAVAWRDWLLRAVAGDPGQIQIMYGLGGERQLPELELGWLSGYEGSRPVRVGNGAASQRQLDVYGEVIDTLYQARRSGLAAEPETWHVEQALLDWLESGWREPDSGLWEIRGDPRHYVHSKVMSWVAFDRAVRSIEQFHEEGDTTKWAATRDEIHREVCELGWDAERSTFTQSYGSSELDASLLMIPMVGFLPPDDPRVGSTVEAIRRELSVDGFIARYPTDGSSPSDGMAGEEGAFLLCSFWLADALALCGRVDEAEAQFERLLALRNDVGLLSEEYDPVAGRMLGNFPQAFSHVGLAGTALNLSQASGPANERKRR
ncbi:MAG: glycoside hydrolase family 15 protein [Microthrixaceae bacterium]